MATYTSNLNLKKPGENEDALIQDINDNMDKLDAFAGDMRNSSIGTFTTLSGFADMLDTLLVAMPSNGVKSFSVDCAANVGVFTSSTRYFGTLFKSSTSTSYAHVEMRAMASTVSIIGRRISTGGYDWARIGYYSAWETITPTVDNTRITAGQVQCIKRDGFAYIYFNGVKFAASGNNQLGVVSGLPQALIQGSGMFTGENATKNVDIANAGDGFWIATNGTAVNVHIGSTYNYTHWGNLMYPCV